MAFQHKPNTGSVFVNDKKETEGHPDFKGDGVFEGTPVWLSAWKNKSGEGKTYLKIAMKPKDGATLNATVSTDVGMEVSTEDPFDF